MTTDTARSALGRFLGVAVDPQTYRNLAYLLLAFPLGIVYFTVFWGGGAAGLATVPILVGVPVLVALLAVATTLADLESRLAAGLLGADVSAGATRPGDETLGEYVQRIALDPRSYLAVGYLLSKFVIGLVAFVALVTSATLSATLVLAPALYQRPGIAYQFGARSVETLPVALGLSVTGVLLALVSLHLLNGAAWLVGEYTEVMLGSGERDD